MLTEAGIDLKGIVLNADSGFDAAVLHRSGQDRQIEAHIDLNLRNNNAASVAYRYFDEELYKRRFVIERMNAWLDSFNVLLIRFETKANTWTTLHFLAFIVLLCKKISIVNLSSCFYTDHGEITRAVVILRSKSIMVKK